MNHFWFRRPYFCAFAAFFLVCGSLFAQVAPDSNFTPIPEIPTKQMVVGIKEAAPFAMRNANGEWEGIAVDLWQLVADDLGLNFRLEEQSLPELLEGVKTNQLDLGIGAITVSAARERMMDFSQPFDYSGIGVAAKIGDNRFAQLFASLFSWAFLKAIAALFLVLVLAGAAVWYAERKHESNAFGGKPLGGIGNGFWWAAVTITTVGYGDKAPATLPGRVIGLIWMFIGVITISGFTAAIASTLTASNLKASIHSPADLDRVRLGAVSGTFGAEILQSRGLNFRGFSSYEEALEELKKGDLGAVVHDQPLLVYEVRKNHTEEIEVMQWPLAQQSYAFALPTDSPLREHLNRSLLEVLGTPSWMEIRRRYLGTRHEN